MTTERIKLLIIIFPILFVINGCSTEPTLEETVNFLKKNGELFNEKKDLKHISFDSETVTFSLRIIHSDDKTGEFKKNVESVVVTCFADSLSRISRDTATSLSFNKKGKTMLSLKIKFSSPCKVNKKRISKNYNNLRDFYGSTFNLYYWDWSTEEFENIKKAMELWGKLNHAST